MHEWIKMDDSGDTSSSKSPANVHTEGLASPASPSKSNHTTEEATRIDSALTQHPLQPHDDSDQLAPQPQEYRVYKRRWFGLFQLVLLNIIVSWDVS
jgi:hypothetical protein